MKKFLTIFLCILCVFLASCSNDGKDPGSHDTGSNGSDSSNAEIPADSNTFSFNTRGMKNIVSSKVDIKIGSWESSSRAISDDVMEDQTLLLWYNERDQLAPLVFRNSDGKYVMFSVTDTFPLSDDVFAVEFNHILVSNRAPAFLMEESVDKETSKKTKTPVVEDVEQLKDYEVSCGQLIVSTKTGKAAFLTYIDFSKFTHQYNGHYYLNNSSVHPYDLKSGFVYDHYAYFVYSNWENDVYGVYRIDINDPKEAVPMTNMNFDKVYNILGGNSEILVTSGRDNNQIIDLSRKQPIAPGRDIFGEQRIEVNGYSHRHRDVGLFRDEILIGDDWWNIKPAMDLQVYYKTADGKDFAEPDLKEGFYAGNTPVTPDMISGNNIGNFWITIGDQQNTIAESYNGFYYLTYFTETTPLYEDAEHLRPLINLDMLFSGDKEFTVGSKTYNAEEIITTGTEPYIKTPDSFLYYILDKDDYMVSRDNPEDKILVDGQPVKFTPNLWKRGVYIDAFDFPIYRDDSYSFNYGATQSARAETDRTGRYVLRYTPYLKDKESKTLIKNTYALLDEGIYYYDGSKVNYDSHHGLYIVRGTGSDKEELYLSTFGDDPRYTIPDGFVLSATRLDTHDNQNVKADMNLAVRLSDVSSDYWNTKGMLRNVIETETPGVYDLYYSVEPDDKKKDGMFYIIRLDTTGSGSMTVEREYSIGKTRLPDFKYSSLNDAYVETDKSMVWSQDGTKLYWITRNDTHLYELDLETGKLTTVNLPNRIAGNELARIGNRLIFSIFTSGVDVSTYSLFTNDLEGELILVSTSNMAMIPLVELNATNL